METVARNVEIEVLAAAIRHQEKRFQDLIRGLEKSGLAPDTARKVLAQIERDLRTVPAGN